MRVGEDQAEQNVVYCPEVVDQYTDICSTNLKLKKFHYCKQEDLRNELI